MIENSAILGSKLISNLKSIDNPIIKVLVLYYKLRKLEEEDYLLLFNSMKKLEIKFIFLFIIFRQPISFAKFFLKMGF